MGAFEPQSSYADSIEETVTKSRVSVNRDGEMRSVTETHDLETGSKEKMTFKVGKDGYTANGVEDGEKVSESGKEINAAQIKAMMDAFRR